MPFFHTVLILQVVLGITKKLSLRQDTTIQNSIHEHSILQSSAVKSAPTKKSSSISKKQNSVRGHQLEELFQNANALVKEGKTPAVEAFVRSVFRDLETDVIPAMRQEHLQDQELLERLQAAVGGVDGVIARAATYVSTLTALRADYEETSEGHTTCRGEESAHCPLVADCESRLETADLVLGRNESLVQSLQIQIMHGSNGDPHGWCPESVDTSALSFRDKSRVIMEDYLDAEAQSDVARAARDAISGECANKQSQFEAKRELCNILQRSLEEKSCEFASSTLRWGAEVREAWTAATTSYYLVMDATQENEAHRKLEFTTLERTKCLLDRIYDASEVEEPCNDETAVPPGQVSAQIESCHDLVVDTAEFDIEYHVFESPPSMPAMPVYPCSQPFYDAQYRALDPVDTCGGPITCNPCHEVAEYVTVGGCQQSQQFGSDRIPRKIMGFEEVADVRCCSSDGVSCTTEWATGVIACSALTGKTFFEADKICTDNGLHLCSEEELGRHTCGTCGTDCGFDSHSVWTNREETEPPVCCREDTLECIACRAEREPPVCCHEHTLECLACEAGVTEQTYCEMNAGCGVCFGFGR